MLEPEIPENETERICELQSLHVLDTAPEERFDRITRVASALFEVPIALVSMVDVNRQWFKSCVGLSASETGRDISFCGHTIMGDDIMMVEDATKDVRFADNPLVTGEPNIRFYAGFPLKMPSGNSLGTLCLIDSKPRQFTPQQHALLADLGEIVISEFVSQQAATIDPLTRLFNRRGFEVLARKAIANSRRYRWSVSLVYFDLNKFKAINDNYGHNAGDQALVELAAILGKVMRESDIVARIGGDEFVVMLMNASESKARFKTQRLLHHINEKNNSGELPFQLSVSYGIVGFDSARHKSLDDMLRDGDEAMYRHKSEGSEEGT